MHVVARPPPPVSWPGLTRPSFSAAGTACAAGRRKTAGSSPAMTVRECVACRTPIVCHAATLGATNLKQQAGGHNQCDPTQCAPAVEKGELQIGTWVNIARSPAYCALLNRPAWISPVWIWSTPPSIETIADFALLPRAIDFPIVVRPPKANREWITRLLDIGVWNLHCPQVETADQAAEIVAASRYAPKGLRGNAGSTRRRISRSTDQCSGTPCFRQPPSVRHGHAGNRAALSTISTRLPRWMGSTR